MFLHVAIAGKQRLGRERDDYFRQSVRVNSRESAARHTDDGERRALDLQHLADYAAISAVMALPETVGKHGYRRGRSPPSVVVLCPAQTTHLRGPTPPRTDTS